MLTRYLKLAIRTLLRSKLYAFINIVGLGVAIACRIVAYVNYEFGQSFDAFHENAASICRIKSKILSAGMGLFALVSLNIARRSKEIGIRKVLGASFVSIVRLFSREFVWLLAIAAILAAASGYFLFDALLSSIYAYYADFGVKPFIAASGLVVLVAMLTVGSQVYRAALSNPVAALRDE